MNKVIIIGNLAADPETRQTSQGTSVCTFRVAVQRRFANQQGVREADFLNVVAWRQLADLCGRYLAKGRRVCVEGSLQTRTYDAQDGSKRYVTEIVAENVEFLNSREDGSRPRTDNPPPPSEPPRTAAPNTYTEVDDDELPF